MFISGNYNNFKRAKKKQKIRKSATPRQMLIAVIRKPIRWCPKPKNRIWWQCYAIRLWDTYVIYIRKSYVYFTTTFSLHDITSLPTWRISSRRFFLRKHNEPNAEACWRMLIYYIWIHMLPLSPFYFSLRRIHNTQEFACMLVALRRICIRIPHLSRSHVLRASILTKVLARIITLLLDVSMRILYIIIYVLLWLLLFYTCILKLDIYGYFKLDKLVECYLILMVYSHWFSWQKNERYAKVHENYIVFLWK